MSDADKKKDESDLAIHAVAPRLSQEEGQVDVSSSPAFQCLDDVSNYKIENANVSVRLNLFLKIKLPYGYANFYACTVLNRVIVLVDVFC